MSDNLKRRSIPVLNAVIPLPFAFALGGLFTMMAGYNPLTVYGLIRKTAFASGGGWMQTLGFACPIILTGIATAFAFQSDAGISAWKGSCISALCRRAGGCGLFRAGLHSGRAPDAAVGAGWHSGWHAVCRDSGIAEGVLERKCGRNDDHAQLYRN